MESQSRFGRHVSCALDSYELQKRVQTNVKEVALVQWNFARDEERILKISRKIFQGKELSTQKGLGSARNMPKSFPQQNIAVQLLDTAFLISLESPISNLV